MAQKAILFLSPIWGFPVKQKKTAIICFASFYLVRMLFSCHPAGIFRTRKPEHKQTRSREFRTHRVINKNPPNSLGDFCDSDGICT